jgi:class 3 adenylate cyclase
LISLLEETSPSKMGRKPHKAESGPSRDIDIEHLLRTRDGIDSALCRHKAQLAILFTDIVGSTSFFERFGDTAGLVMLHRHDRLVMPLIRANGGMVVKTIGDAVLAMFTSARAAVDTAIRIQQQLDAYNSSRTPEEQIYLRVGINFGSGFLKDKDVYGDVVNVAARFVKACAPAQILVSRSVYEALGNDHRVTCRRLGSARVHGKNLPEEMYEILWTSSDYYKGLRQLLDAGQYVRPLSRVLSGVKNALVATSLLAKTRVVDMASRAKKQRLLVPVIITPLLLLLLGTPWWWDGNLESQPPGGQPTASQQAMPAHAKARSFRPVLAKPHSFKLYQDAMINGTRLNRGSYRLEPYGSDKVLIYRNKDLVTKAPVKVKPLKKGTTRSSVRLDSKGNVREVRTKKEVVVFLR